MSHPIEVHEHTTYLIIPFAFRGDLPSTIGKVSSSVFQEEKIKSGDRFFDHIECLVRQTGELEDAIGKQFLLSPGYRKSLRLPSNRNQQIRLWVKDALLASFALEDIWLYLFESQVGFLVFKAVFKGELTLQQVLEANYYLKKITQRDIRLNYRTGAVETDIQEFRLLHVVNELTGPLDVSTFFEGQQKQPAQAILFSSTILKETLHDRTALHTHLFRARRAFKASYLPHERELDAANNPEIVSLFRNSHWGVSLEGLANIVEMARAGEDADGVLSNAFFSSGYTSTLEKNYLFMYILALHQRFGLLYLSIEASELSRRFDAFQKEPLKQIHAVTEMHLRLVRFKLRATFTQISNVTHQDKLYSQIRTVLRIEELLNELHHETESLSALLQIAELRQTREQDERKQDKSDSFQRALGIVSLIFLPFGAVTGFFGMNYKFTSTELLTPSLFFYSIGGTYIVSLLVYYLWIHQRKDGGDS